MSELFEALKRIERGQKKDRQGPIPPFIPFSKKRATLGRAIIIGVVVLLLALAGGLELLHNVPTKQTTSNIPHEAKAPTKVAQLQKEVKEQVASVQKEPIKVQKPLKPLQAFTFPQNLHHTARQIPPKPLPQQKAHPPEIRSPLTKSSNEKVRPPQPPLESTENYKYTYLLMSANEALKGGDLERALRLYQEYAVNNPKNSKVWNNIGVIYLRMSEPKLALSALEKAHSINPEDPEIGVNRAMALWASGKKGESLREVEGLKVRNDLPPLAVYNLAALMIRMGLTSDAYSLVQKAEGRLGHIPLLISLHPYFRGLENRGTEEHM